MSQASSTEAGPPACYARHETLFAQKPATFDNKKARKRAQGCSFQAFDYARCSDLALHIIAQKPIASERSAKSHIGAFCA